jgi:hypothetical protein
MGAFWRAGHPVVAPIIGEKEPIWRGCPDRHGGARDEILVVERIHPHLADRFELREVRGATVLDGPVEAGISAL